MSHIIGSIISNKNNKSGIFILDTHNSKICHLHLLDLKDSLGNKKHLRGLSVWDDSILAVTPTEIVILKENQTTNGPLLKISKKIIRPEWSLGNGYYGNLHSVHQCPIRKRIYVTFNSQCAVDTFDYDGTLLNRRYLWEISPEVFEKRIKKNNKQNITYGVVKQIFSDTQNRILLTISNIFGKNKGGIFDLETGEQVVKNLQCPHSCFISDGSLFYSELLRGRIFRHNYDGKKISPDRMLVYATSDRMSLRGAICNDNSLFIGLCTIGRSPNKKTPRIEKCDMDTGKSIADIVVPDIEGFHRPQVYALSSAPEFISKRLETNNRCFTFYLNDKKVVLPDQSFVSHYRSAPFTSNSNSLVQIPLESKKTESSSNSPIFPIPMVVCKDVSLFFRRNKPILKTLLIRQKKSIDFTALSDVSFVVNEGDTLGIIGRNGSGKSTLSLVCTKVYKPDTGEVIVNGKVQLLSLGIGFQPKLSGRENVYNSGSLLGLRAHEISECMPEIESFADIGDFIDEPVRTYSSGMRSRLAFSIATAIRPDILILDEVLATGDKAFQAKAMSRMKNLRELAKCVIIISHNPPQIKKLCNRVLWIEKGRLLMNGKPGKVLKAYDKFCNNPEKWLDRNKEISAILNAGNIY